MAGTASRDHLLRLLGPVVETLGLDLEDVEVTPAGRRRVLRVVVDRDGGVELDAVAEVSTAVAARLDESDAMGAQPYVLEVSSPGVDRPLTLPRHWRRARTRLVEATLTDGRRTTGRVIDAGDDGVRLDVDGAEQHLAWADVVRGQVQVEFNRTRGAEE